MKFSKLFAAAAVLAIAGSVQAQNSISSTNFSTAVADTGYIRNEGAIWNLTWSFSDGSIIAFADNGFSAHTNQVSGTPVTSDASSFQTDLTAFGSETAIADLTGTLNVDVADGTGSVGIVTFEWILDNAGGTPINLTIVKFLDADVNPFDSNLTALTDGTELTDYTIVNSIGVPAIGLAGSTDAIDISSGFVLDSDTDPTSFLGFGDSGGSSFWWSSSSNFAGLGVEDNNGAIPAALTNTIATNGAGDGDTDNNFVQDNPQDSGVALQFDITVPATGSATLTTYLVTGISQEVQATNWTGPYQEASVTDWTMMK